MITSGILLTLAEKHKVLPAYLHAEENACSLTAVRMTILWERLWRFRLREP
jgi:hypothetical protein